MPQYRLIVPHTHPASQQWLDSGTIVGDDTPYPWVDTRGNPVPPSLGMAGVDEASQKEIDKHYDENVRNDPFVPKHGDDQDATKDMTINRPNPNVSPVHGGAGSQSQPTKNETVADPLRRGPAGAVPSEDSKPPKGGVDLSNPTGKP